jgi:hypothetical protein
VLNASFGGNDLIKKRIGRVYTPDEKCPSGYGWGWGFHKMAKIEVSFELLMNLMENCVNTEFTH